MALTQVIRKVRWVRGFRLRWLAIWAATGLAQAQSGDIATRFGSDIDTHIARNYASLDALYKDIHAHPELAFEERNTARKLASAMRELGFEVTEGIAKTGLVAMLRNGAGPTVMVRTELDALPMEEKSGLPYASKVKTTYAGRESFVAHSCGHDLHMAAWVGTAKTLVSLTDDFAEFVAAGVPSMFFFIGVHDPKDVEASRQPGGQPLPINHSPFFAPVPEPSIKTGVKAMSVAVLTALQR